MNRWPARNATAVPDESPVRDVVIAVPSAARFALRGTAAPPACVGRTDVRLSGAYQAIFRQPGGAVKIGRFGRQR